MLETDPFLKAIELYAQITGVKPPESDADRYGRFSMGKYEVNRNYDNLKEAVDLDPSSLTANLMLSYYVRDMLGDQKLSMLDLLNDADAFLKKLEKPRELLALVNREDVTRARDLFIKRLSDGLKHYGAEKREDIQKTLTQHDTIAFLRRDALRGVERLRVNQFLSGEPEKAGVKPVFHTKAMQWWNINSLLNAATQMPSGVSLNLIRDRDAFQSYFVFCIRNGANLFILSDAPEYSHPLQGQMSRRPDRALGDRACRAWFPYDLLGLKWDEEDERWYIENSDAKAVAVYQQEYKPLAPISEFQDPRETIWVTMMLDLIVKKFWGENFQAPALSYTGEMLKIEDRLIGKAETANLPVTGYEPLALPALTLADLTTDAVTEEQVGEKAHQPNRWLEERYKDKVNPATFNLVEQVGTVVLLPDAKSEKSWEKLPEGTKIEGGLRKVTSTEISKLGHFDKELTRKSSLQVMDSTRFGTREELEADRIFIARYNMAGQIGSLAHAEFKDREKEIVDWYTRACKKNLPTILSWAANKEIWFDGGLRNSFSHDETGGIAFHDSNLDAESQDARVGVTRSWIARFDIDAERRDKYGDSMGGFSPVNLGDYRHPNYLCAVTGARATYMAVFYPNCPEHLALLAGCKVEELPDVLQHWTTVEKYIGNSILNRIDPMNWHIGNPWRELNLRVRVPLSIRGLKQIEKAPALPPLSNLLDPEKAQEFSARWAAARK